VNAVEAVTAETATLLEPKPRLITGVFFRQKIHPYFLTNPGVVQRTETDRDMRLPLYISQRQAITA